MHIYVATPDASLSSDGDRTVTAPLRTEGPAGRLLLLLLPAGAWWTGAGAMGVLDGRRVIRSGRRWTSQAAATATAALTPTVPPATIVVSSRQLSLMPTK